MKLILDTHSLVWWLLDDTKLSKTAREAIESAEETWVSTVTAFEMATKHRAGKWPEIKFLLDTFPLAMEQENLSLLEVKVDHAILGGLIDVKHRDPFDRLLAAQAKIENLVLVTRDPAFIDFGVTTLW